MLIYSFTSRQFGYSDVKEYYKDACLVGKINNIKIPVLALNAEDDPFQVCASNFHRLVSTSASINCIVKTRNILKISPVKHFHIMITARRQHSNGRGQWHRQRCYHDDHLWGPHRFHGGPLPDQISLFWSVIRAICWRSLSEHNFPKFALKILASKSGRMCRF